MMKNMMRKVIMIFLAVTMILTSLGLYGCDGNGIISPGDIISDQEGDAPIFSLTSGFYDKKESLKLAIPKNFPEGTVIRYTMDGSTPTADSSRYKVQLGLMTTKSTTVVKAALFSANGEILSDVITHTYIKTDNKAHTNYTVMINMKPGDLGEMLANPTAKIEKPMHVDIMSKDGEVVISQDAGIRIFGGSSRGLEQKSFKIIARKDGYFGDIAYEGKGSFHYPFFPERKIMAGENAGEVLDKFDSLILRNGGNDSFQHSSVDPTYASLLRDGISNNFAFKHSANVSSQLSMLVEVYLNGEYYGILDMKENLNEDYVSRIYDVSDDDVVIIKSELDTSRHCDIHDNGSHCRFDNVWFYYETDEDEVSQKALADFEALMKQVQKNVNASDAVYKNILAKVKAAVDLDSFMEYTALELFMCNTDWPHNNLKIWKYSGEPIEGISITDGKWRFMMRDNDMNFGRYESRFVLSELYSQADTDTFYRILGNYYSKYNDMFLNDFGGSDEYRLYPDSLYLQGLFAFLMRDDNFRSAFTEYAASLCTPAAKVDLLTEYQKSYSSIAQVIPYHLKRWNLAQTPSDWEHACTIIQSFIANRSNYFLKYMDTAIKAVEEE